MSESLVESSSHTEDDEADESTKPQLRYKVKSLTTQLAFTLKENEALCERIEELHLYQEQLDQKYNEMFEAMNQMQAGSQSDLNLEGGQNSSRFYDSLGNVKKLKQLLDVAQQRVKEAQQEVDIERKQKLVLKQINNFNACVDKRADNLLYNHNFELQQEIIKKDNIITNLEKTITDLKNSKKDDVKFVEKMVCQPTPQVLKLLNQEARENIAVQQNKELKKKIEEMEAEIAMLKEDNLKHQNMA